MINRDSGLARAFWERGRLDDCPILDFHAHMHTLASMYLPSASPEAMIETMKRCNTKMTAFCSHMALYHAWAEEAFNLSVAQKYPDYFRAYHAVIPGVTDYKQAVCRMEAHPSCYLGFKFHCDSHHTPLTDKAYAPFLSYMNARGLPALLHTWGGSEYNGVSVIREAAERHPNAVFICGHSFHGDWVNGAKMAKLCPNIYYELTAVMDNDGAIEILSEYAGSDRILFGTDLPWFDTRHGVGAVLSADINDEDRRNIFYKNGEKLLRSLGHSTGL